MHTRLLIHHTIQQWHSHALLTCWITYGTAVSLSVTGPPVRSTLSVWRGIKEYRSLLDMTALELTRNCHESNNCGLYIVALSAESRIQYWRLRRQSTTGSVINISIMSWIVPSLILLPTSTCENSGFFTLAVGECLLTGVLNGAASSSINCSSKYKKKIIILNRKWIESPRTWLKSWLK